MCGLGTKNCRSCRAFLVEKSLNLHGKYKTLSGNSKYLTEIYFECTGVDVQRDSFSKSLCSKCASILIAAYEFKLMTRTSEKALNIKVESQKSPKKYIRKSKNQWKAHRCPAYGCNLIFRFHVDLARHLTEMRGTDSHNFICDKCGKKYATKDNVRCHLQQFHKDYKCGTCEKVFNGRHNLYVHRKKAHETKRTVICPECGKTFSSNDVLKRHIRGVHEKRLDYECHVCGRRCLTTSNLRTHLLIHQDNKFSCEICNKTFKQMVNLKLHKKLHKNTSKYECDVCQLRMKTKNSLREHRKLHFLTVEFDCEICGASFGRLAYLREHTKLVH